MIFSDNALAYVSAPKLPDPRYAFGTNKINKHHYYEYHLNTVVITRIINFHEEYF